MSGSPTTMMVLVPQLGRGLQMQHCTVSLPRIDALLDDPQTRYFVFVEQKVVPSISVRGGAYHRGPRRETLERMHAQADAG